MTRLGTNEWWAVRGPTGFISEETLSDTRIEAISKVVYEYLDTCDTWKQLYRKGYRVVKVEIREVE